MIKLYKPISGEEYKSLYHGAFKSTGVAVIDKPMDIQRIYRSIDGRHVFDTLKRAVEQGAFVSPLRFKAESIQELSVMPVLHASPRYYEPEPNHPTPNRPTINYPELMGRIVRTTPITIESRTYTAPTEIDYSEFTRGLGLERAFNGMLSDLHAGKRPSGEETPEEELRRKRADNEAARRRLNTRPNTGL